MSGSPSFQQILEVDAGAFRKASQRWDALARRLDERADALIPTVKHLPEAWRGGAATQGITACEALRKELEVAYVPTQSIGQALARHADGVESLRRYAHDFVARAKAAHVTVGADGSLTMDAGHQDEWTARSLSVLVRERDELVTAAQTLDAQTATSIGENLAGAPGAPLARVPRESVPAAGSDPRQVKAWWDSLTPEQRRFVLSEYPDLVGSLDGVPIEDRDIANRIVLDRDADGLRTRKTELDEREAYIRSMIEQGRGGELYPGESNRVGAATAELERIAAERGEIEGKLKGIGVIDNRLGDQTPGQQRAYLIGFGSGGDGQAIVSVGNPDDADNVLTYVPGTGADLSKVRGDLARAEFMADDAARLDPDSQTATIMWLGYDAPDGLTEAASGDSADGGSGDLRRFQDGLRVTHTGETSHNVVLGHSYGSTVIGHTATGGLNADDLIFVGSPGVGVDSAADLHITGGDSTKHVWASTAENDPIQAAGLDDNLIHGENPNNPGFGGRVFDSDPGTPQWTWRDPLSFSPQAHSDYWVQDSASRENITRILVGSYGDVT